MIDSIGSGTGISSTQRAQATQQTNALRNNPDVLNAVVQTQQKQSNAVSRVQVFAVPQTTKSGNSSSAKLPRGSLVDVLA